MAATATETSEPRRRWPDERAGGAAATLVVHVALGLGLLWGLGAPLPRIVDRALEVFAVAPPPAPAVISIPPPPPAPRDDAARRRAAPDREGAASPPNLRSEPTPVVAPTPIVPIPVPPPIVAAPVAGQGSDPSAGAAPVRGPGTGAGGIGEGRGAGFGGDGGGGGEGRGFGRVAPPRHLSGRITEIPSWAWEQGMQGTVGVRYSVAVNGRVVNCRITRSSGYRQLDVHTCDLIQRRFRFSPARDENGDAFQSDIVENHSWEIRDEPDDY